jgi:hypothetical protein
VFEAHVQTPAAQAERFAGRADQARQARVERGWRDLVGGKARGGESLGARERVFAGDVDLEVILVGAAGTLLNEPRAVVQHVGRVRGQAGGCDRRAWESVL